MQHRTMRSVEFRHEREASWRELEALIADADTRGLRALSAHQLARLPHLYRATLSSLSVARSISLDRALVAYLENLVGRAYFVVYGTRQVLRQHLADFFLWRLPQAVRDARWHLAVAALILLAGALAAFAMTLADQELYYVFVGDMAGGRTPASSTEELRAGLYDDGGGGAAMLTTFAAQLFSHNSRIGILAFALGFVAGLPTLLLLFYNGLTLGGFAALYHDRGLSADLWGWLLPHGITELLAVVLCGAAGLLLAHGLVFPGAKPRLDGLRERGRHAALVVVGAVLMLFFAGGIEGIFRQSVTHMGVRYGVATLTAGWWVYYFGFVGKARAATVRALAAQDAEARETGAASAPPSTVREAARPAASSAASEPRDDLAAVTSGRWRAAGRPR